MEDTLMPLLFRIWVGVGYGGCWTTGFLTEMPTIIWVVHLEQGLLCGCKALSLATFRVELSGSLQSFIRAFTQQPFEVEKYYYMGLFTMTVSLLDENEGFEVSLSPMAFLLEPLPATCLAGRIAFYTSKSPGNTLETLES